MSNGNGLRIPWTDIGRLIITLIVGIAGVVMTFSSLQGDIRVVKTEMQALTSGTKEFGTELRALVSVADRVQVQFADYRVTSDMSRKDMQAAIERIRVRLNEHLENPSDHELRAAIRVLDARLTALENRNGR